MKVEHWQAEWGAPTEANIRRHLESQGYQVTRYDYPAGACFQDHSHSFDKKDAVVSGTLKIRIAAREFTLEAGDMFAIPAMIVHSAEVIGDETVVSLDASK